MLKAMMKGGAKSARLNKDVREVFESEGTGNIETGGEYPIGRIVRNMILAVFLMWVVFIAIFILLAVLAIIDANTIKSNFLVKMKFGSSDTMTKILILSYIIALVYLLFYR